MPTGKMNELLQQHSLLIPYPISVMHAAAYRDQNRTGAETVSDASEIKQRQVQQMQETQAGGQWMTVREFAQAADMTQQRVSQLLHKSAGRSSRSGST